MSKKNDKLYVYALEIFFACGISFGSQSVHFDNIQTWLAIVARYVVYNLIVKGIHESSVLGFNHFQTRSKLDFNKIYNQSKNFLIIFAASLCFLLYSKQRIFDEGFLLFFIGHLIAKYPEIEQKSSTINYGSGMACSFFEGYLAHIIPSDGARFVGFEDNINIYEAKQGVVFPVKKLFIVITKSLYCPPDLKHFNKKNQPLPYLEACQSLEDVEKDVAGVKNRTYRNSAYKIYRPGLPPVYLAAECATPLHTLHRVLERRALYPELLNIDTEEVVSDFCTMLRSIISRSSDCRDKCELVFYDDKDPNLNLADILLEKIKELEPDFENIITSEPR
ncbi:stimulator of interferon genes protein homolog [Vanessa cardui]|uniref:stimulator of interferon genes protein homolog n=1 Tax=Vanessa cardui TaxID=171605 RepID=UPI001F138E94|nr:stimulator of interferon genes protein homolog [Vanessa cardui]